MWLVIAPGELALVTTPCHTLVAFQPALTCSTDGWPSGQQSLRRSPGSN